MPASTLTTTCAIAGGGPAGMMLGLLLARAGVDVMVLEKHADFLRDFRGDTIHPSTLDVIHEIGLLDEWLERPHQEVGEIGVHIGDAHLKVADFSHLPTRCKYIAFMPQWDFLDFLAGAARRYPGFDLRMNTQAHGVIEEQGRITGLVAEGPEGAVNIHADLVIGADGRGSVIRQQAGLAVRDLGAPIDVLWLRLPRRAGDPAQTLGRVDLGQVLIMIDRGDYWQCAFVIEKDGIERWRQRGIAAFREVIVRLVPSLADRVEALASWDDVKLLTVKVDRLHHWARQGLLCIGDAAHAMSPVGGVGINLAIQDAVAAANRLAVPLREHRVTLNDLRAVQRRRSLPTRLTQASQIFAHHRILGPALRGRGTMSPPWPLQLLDRWPWLRRLPGRAVGMGARAEHVKVAPWRD